MLASTHVENFFLYTHMHIQMNTLFSGRPLKGGQVFSVELNDAVSSRSVIIATFVDSKFMYGRTMLNGIILATVNGSWFQFQQKNFDFPKK